MRYVVTGGLGFIGSHLAETLAIDGHEVFIIDDGRTSAVRTVYGTEVIHEQVQRAYWPDKLDGIFHLAGPVGPVGVLNHAGYIVRDVIEMATTVAVEALVNHCPIVFVSTSEVYGLQPQPVNERSPQVFGMDHSARKEYAVAKLAAETMLLNDATLTAGVTIIRPFNVAGPRQQTRGGFVIPRFIDQAMRGIPLTVYVPGTQQRAFTHVLDIVDGIRLAMINVEGRQVFNLGNPLNVCTIEQLAAEVIEEVGRGGSIEMTDPTALWGSRFREAPDKIPDPALAIEKLQWHPTRDRATIIREAIEEYCS